MPVSPSIPAQFPSLLLADLSVEEAIALDREVDQHIQTHGRQTIELYMALGRCLAKLHAGRGYKALGFQNWKGYLASKPDFGRTYLSYIVKVGEAMEMGKLALDPFLADGLNGTVLLLYAQMTDQPDKIQDLIASTWTEVKGKSVRDVEKALKDYVDAHWETYRKRPKPQPDSPHTGNWQSIWEADFRGLGAEAQAVFIQEMWAFLEHHDHGSHPTPTP